MPIGKFTSVSKLLEHSAENEGVEKESEQRGDVLTPSEFEPFKMLFKYIRPESSILSSNKLMADSPSCRKINETESEVVREETPLLNINSIQSVCLSRMGIRNYDNMENQDVILEDQISNKCKIFGIFDGHGQYGKIIASTAKSIFQNLLQKYSEDIKNENSMLSIETIIRKVLEKTNSYLLHYKVQEAQFSGTTVLLVILTPKKIYTFNVGNSRAVLAKHYKQTDRIESFQLTHDHTISRFDERLRIIENGGVIGPYKNERGEQIGPQRIWAKNEPYPGLYVTRTLGLSCAYKLGVLSTPQVSIIEYRSNYRFLILGSDGLWAVEENDQAVRFIEKQYMSQLHNVANSLMVEAVKRWRNRNELMDDITLIIISLF